MKRPIRIEGDAAYVPLTRGYEAVIDAADVHLVDGYNWCAHLDRRSDGTIRAVYAVRTAYDGIKRLIRMHRIIIDAPHGFEADHISGDGLDNRRANLRVATKSQNIRNQGKQSTNTSGFKGVSFSRATGKWQASIGVDAKQRYLGVYNTPEEAHAAYARASAELHGEFGRAA